MKNWIHNCKILGFIIASLLTFGACQDGVLYEKTQEIHNGIWSYKDTLAFAFTPPDTTTRYDISLNITHTGAYPNQNIYTKVHTIYPDKSRKTQILSFDLAENSGAWYGTKSWFSDTYTCEYLMQKGIFFPSKGTYGMVIEQYSRESELKNINAVEVIVEKSIPSKETK